MRRHFLQRAWAVSAAWLAVCLAPGVAQAQPGAEWPARPIRIVVPYPRGRAPT